MCIFVYPESPQESKYRRTTGYTCFHRAINIQLSIKNIFVYSMLSKTKVNKIKLAVNTPRACENAEKSVIRMASMCFINRNDVVDKR